MAAIGLCSISAVHAGSLIEAAQQILKHQGFYYGNVDGKKNSETVAAIRRYQIRNGLKINGELNTETQRSLGVRAEQEPTAAMTKETLPSSRDGSVALDKVTSPNRDGTISSARPLPNRDNTPGRQLETSAALNGAPYEIASTHPQHVVANAQITLARRGYYRGDIDGVYGPATEFALRAYQARVGLAITGRLDFETLAAMGILPGTQRWSPPRRGFLRQRPEPIHQGEWVPE
ncbi:MAG: peptidoglycan-binding domain-containing protein [Verrucomicrobiota bacterium]